MHSSKNPTPSLMVTALMLAAGVLFLPLLATAQVGQAYQGSFPDFPEVEYEQSVITIPIYLPGETEPAEILELDAYMRLDREAATRNGLGHRQFEFTIADWELIGYSTVLEDFITFTLSDTIQPKSLGVALQEDSDFPAMIVYSAIYDIWLGSKRIAANRPGVAFAKNVMEIPPRDITVAFEKPFSSALFSFLSGTCEAMHRILDWLLSWAKETGGMIRDGKITELPLPAPPEGAAEAGYIPPRQLSDAGVGEGSMVDPGQTLANELRTALAATQDEEDAPEDEAGGPKDTGRDGQERPF